MGEEGEPQGRGGVGKRGARNLERVWQQREKVVQGGEARGTACLATEDRAGWGSEGHAAKDQKRSSERWLPIW